MKFDIVISFAGENRDIADLINEGLKIGGIKTFYDEDHEAFLWGKFLSEELLDIYASQGKYCLMIVSKFYLEKSWPRHERRAAISRLIKEEGEYVLPYVVDETTLEDIPGLNPDIYYLRSSKTSPFQVVEILLEKLGSICPAARRLEQETCARLIINQIYRRTHPLETDGSVSEPYRTKLATDFFRHYNVERVNSEERRRLGRVFNVVLAELVKQGRIYVVYNGELGDAYNLTEQGYDLWKQLGTQNIDIMPDATEHS